MKYFFLASVFICLAVLFSFETGVQALCCYTATGTEQDQTKLPDNALKLCKDEISCSVS